MVRRQIFISFGHFQSLEINLFENLSLHCLQVYSGRAEGGQYLFADFLGVSNNLKRG